MTFAETVRFLFSLGPELKTVKWDLERIRALMTVAVEGNRTDEVLKALRGDPAVCSLHTTNGRWDIVAYGEEGDYFLTFTLSSRTKEDFDKHLAAFTSQPLNGLLHHIDSMSVD